ncbi:MAG: hypothetical protein NVS1B1_00760 [Candidatus Limnocylindrales bacterium]
MATPRLTHAATLLPSGKVLIVGGYSGPSPSSALVSAELYNPGTNSWSSTGSLITARGDIFWGTLLGAGSVLVVGGGNPSGVLASAELYDYRSGTWSPTGSLAAGRSDYFLSLLLPSGKVLIAGGNGPGNLASAELYTPPPSYGGGHRGRHWGR